MAKKKEENPYLGGSINAGKMNNINQYAKEVASDPEALKTYRENEAEKTAQTIKELEAMTQKPNVMPVANASNAPAMDLSRSDDKGVPYVNQNAPSVVANRELHSNYSAAKDKNAAAQKELEALEAMDAASTENKAPTEDEIAERQKIADGIAQEKAQREAVKAKETPVQPITPVGQAENAPATPAAPVTSGAPSTSVNLPATPAAQASVKEGVAAIKETVGKPSTVKSTVSSIGNIRGSGSTGYDVVGLRSANESQGAQSTTSANVSSGTTQQTQRTDFDPNKATENVAALDPFLEKVDKEGAAKAFLDVYGEKPSPDALNKAAELARKKNKIAVLSESLRVLFDMGAAAGGGNVYKRDQVQKNIAETKAELNKEEAKYQDALDKFNQGLLGAKDADLGTKRALMNDAIKAGFSTTSQGKSDQSTVAGSNTTSKQSSIGKQERPVVNQEYEYNKSLALGAASRGEKNTQIITTVVDPKTGQTREQLYTQFNPTEWAAVKPRARMYLADNPKVIKDAATRYGVSEEIIKKVLAGKYSEKEKIGTKDGTMSYEDLSDDLVRNFSMQDPRAKAVLDYRRTDQGIDKDKTRTGVVTGTIMDFTDNQQPADNSGANIPWQPNAGNPNELLDQLGNE